MNWVCDFCSTVNDGKAVTCFVCEQRRSEVAIRAAKREEREKKKTKVLDVLYKVINKTSKYAFVIPTVGLSVTLTILMIIMLVNRDFSSVVNATTAMIQSAQINIASCFNQNFSALWDNIVSSSSLRFAVNGQSISECLVDKFSTTANMLIFLIDTKFVEKITSLVVNTIPAFFENLR